MNTKQIINAKAFIAILTLLLLSSIFIVGSPSVNAHPSVPEDIEQLEDTIELKNQNSNNVATVQLTPHKTQDARIFISMATTKSRSLSDLSDGDLVRATGTDDVFIIKKVRNTYYKRLILNPAIFESYGHLHWEDVQEVNKSLLNKIKTSNLVRHIDGGAVYALFAHGDTGLKRHIQMTPQQFRESGYTWDMVYDINEKEAGPDFYKTGTPITSSTQTRTTNIAVPDNLVLVGSNSSNRTPSTTSRITPRVLPDHLLGNVIAKARKQNRGHCFEEMFGAEQVVGNSIQVPPNLCVKITRKTFTNPNALRVEGSYYHQTRGTATTIKSTIFLTISAGNTYKTHRQNRLRSVALGVMVHELCHANQNYHAQVSGASGKRTRSNGTVYYVNPWHNSPAGQKFVEITEYIEPGEMGLYKKPTQSNLPFHQYEYYGYSSKARANRSNAVEFAAEVCTFFFLNQSGFKKSRYSDEATNAVLNHQPLRDWFNEYVKKAP